MGKLAHLEALACLYLGTESKALRWQDDTPSWSPSEETIAAMDMERLGFSPAPTAAPDPANVELKLAKRVRGDDTCGYISGISTDSIYCGAGSCVINSFYSVVGCCTESSVSNCNIATKCLPSSSSRFYSSSDTLMRFCSASSQPECLTYVYSGSAFSSYTLYGCATSESRVIVYANPTDSTVDSEATTTPIIDVPASTPRISTTTPPAPGPTNTYATPASGGSTPVGAIVGGVVGGVAAIALIVFGVIFLLRKKKNDGSNQAPPVMYNPQAPPPGQHPQMYQAAPPSAQPSPGGYAPSNTTGALPPGFAPVDNRQSMLKTPYDVTYDQSGISPPASPPPMSPSPTYQSGVPPYVPSSLGTGPTPPQGGHAPPPPPSQQQQQQQQTGHFSAPPAQAQQQSSQPAHHHQQGVASELPATRGDHELRELA
ncbi:hypothetical protein CTRI78_v001057 [Colletotrichum trifolii]|uniref:Carcinoembryonic antigen-related cell adhesion molecule 1 n=1 Tax=Colletotrichum trifolii TaxID=5466 RepID=A0A4R8RRF8_COLTR|nr:hypothetical protein CTRI78_v001057 [Colletotrichum trifolii]